MAEGFDSGEKGTCFFQTFETAEGPAHRRGWQHWSSVSYTVEDFNKLSRAQTSGHLSSIRGHRSVRIKIKTNMQTLRTTHYWIAGSGGQEMSTGRPPQPSLSFHICTDSILGCCYRVSQICARLITLTTVSWIVNPIWSTGVPTLANITKYLNKYHCVYNDNFSVSCSDTSPLKYQLYYPLEEQITMLFSRYVALEGVPRIPTYRHNPGF